MLWAEAFQLRPLRHCERSEAISASQIASDFVLAMTIYMGQQGLTFEKYSDICSK